MVTYCIFPGISLQGSVQDKQEGPKGNQIAMVEQMAVALNPFQMIDAVNSNNKTDGS